MTELSDEERNVLREAEEHEIELKRSSDRKMAEVVDRLVARTFLRIVSKDGRMPESYSITLRGVSVLRAWYAERDRADRDWMQEPESDACAVRKDAESLGESVFCVGGLLLKSLPFLQGGIGVL